MLKLLLKKQMAEVFRAYFYNTKTNKPISKSGTVTRFVLFGLLMVVLLGGMFAGLSLLICDTLVELGMDWMYFMVMGMMAIVLGMFGSVFNTYSGLYSAKDNDLLLSMPIPVSDIILARILNVFLLGVMYSAVVIAPAVIVYWVIAPITMGKIIGGIMMLLVISLAVLVLSCFVGWLVAKIAAKLKHKNIVVTIVTLIAVGLYYFLYFKANLLLRQVLANAVIYGEKIKGAAYALYLFGCIGQGDALAILAYLAIEILLGLLAWKLISGSFLSIASGAGTRSSEKKAVKMGRQRGTFGTLLAKEFSLFTSSSTYMMNCGLGVLVLPILAVLLLFKGAGIVETMDAVFGAGQGRLLICLAAAAAGMAEMNCTAVPSVSLEGKHFWQMQALPIDPFKMLLAKLSVELLLTELPMLLLVICGLIVIPHTAAELILVLVFTVIFVGMKALFDLVIGVARANLIWSSKVTPIKRSAAVLIALFGGWLVVALFAGLYFWKAYVLGPVAYLGIWTVVCAALAIYFYQWLRTRGVKKIAEL